MATNQRRRERYKTDETYRERRIREAQEAREQKKLELAKLKRLRGWEPIGTCPDNETILIYDPDIFWPVVAKLVDGHWSCHHYQGPEPRPTHWRRPLKVPMP